MTTPQSQTRGHRGTTEEDVVWELVWELARVGTGRQGGRRRQWTQQPPGRGGMRRASCTSEELKEKSGGWCWVFAERCRGLVLKPNWLIYHQKRNHGIS